MTCAECPREAVERGRCHACYVRRWRAKDLPSRVPPCVLVLAEVRFLCCCPCHERPGLHPGERCACGGNQVLAERLGMSRAALIKALWRARKRPTTLAG